MIETVLEPYIRGELLAAFPAILPDQIIVLFPSGKMDYSKNKVRNSAGTETLSASITIATENKLDRTVFMKAFSRKGLKIGGYEVFQEYQGHELHDYVEAIGMKATVFKLNYTYNIFM
jgi:hypothetical protein